MADQHIYQRRVDLSGNDSLALIARQIAPGARVLDLGTATGYFARALTQEKGCLVDGVERDPEMAREAGRWCRHMVFADLETVSLAAHFQAEAYDAIVCADVLEHLRDPAALLRQLPPLLAADGQVLASIPNAAYAGLVADLIGGEFRYRDEGLLDHTHLRFFTRASARRLFADAGLDAEVAGVTRLPFAQSEFPQALDGLPDAVREHLLRDEDADVYQFILAAHAVGAGAVSVAERPETAVRVDVVIPVYRGFDETRRCLESVLGEPQKTAFGLVVVNDASPEPDLVDWLRGLAEDRRIMLLENPVNEGFGASVNRAAALHPGRDLVLLNSDTVVHGDWLDRLRACAACDERAATVTPLSNNGSIYSYPVGVAGAELPEGWSGAELDDLVREVNAGMAIEIPTAVGFCMYVRRACIADIGLFDVEAFGRGYGEENDFCMRAREAGWRHLLCPDVYVYHRGEVSFGAEATDRRGRAETVLLERWPAYRRTIEEFLACDPLAFMRLRMDEARIHRRPQYGVGLLRERYAEIAAARSTRAEAVAALRQAEDIAARYRGEAERCSKALVEAQSWVERRSQDLKVSEERRRELEDRIRHLEDCICQLKDECSRIRQKWPIHRLYHAIRRRLPKW